MARGNIWRLGRIFNRHPQNSAKRHSQSARLRCQPLEDRITPSTYIVMTTMDNGDNISPVMGSLREGINFVNKFGFTTILFSLPPGSVITPVAPLHPILVPCTIDGVSPAAVSIFGGAAGATAGLTLAPGATGTVINGLGINGFSGPGIKIDASGVKVTACHIGTDPMGSMPSPNMGGGIQINSSGATIGSTDPSKGNLISGNKSVGIDITTSGTGAKILANRIGTNAAGTMPIPNDSHGIRVTAGSATIGGDDAADGAVDGFAKVNNVVFFNGGSGIAVTGKTTSGVRIEGNLIGSNSAHGIHVVDAPGVKIGGTTALAGNTIGVNKGAGIRIEETGGGTLGGGALIQGNLIGANPDGATVLPNSGNGVEIFESDANIIGGLSAAARNIIVGNLGSGVSIAGATATENVVTGNYIGVLADGKSTGGNKLHGIYIADNAAENTVGGSASGAGNIIAFNGESLKLQGHGIVIASGSMNKISRNSIYSNFGRAIDLGSMNKLDGPNLNDRGGDADSGANDLQDYPIPISRPAGPANQGIITWMLESTPNTTFTIELYSNDKVHKSGWGDLQTYLGDVTVTTDATGCVEFTTFSGGKSLISATATNPAGSTSEPSPCDTDTDGLADGWESFGIDINEDGTLDLKLNTDPNHKDIFVEVDAMFDTLGQSRELKINTALVLVTAAFAAAPDSLVHNPDQMNGITLHAVVDEANLANTPLNDVLNDVRAIRNGTGTGVDGRFGSAIDRGDANWINIRAARELVYRYCIFGETAKLDGLNAQGAAELPGKNFAVALPDQILGGITANDRAGVFMHELGHSLGLHHGGNDDVNYKPNYFSVMNYTWAIPNVLGRMTGGVVPDYSTSWKLDYSRSTLPTVDENNLNETKSLGGPAGTFVPTELTPLALVSFSGNPDFNRDGDSSDAGFSRDVNIDGDSNAVLTGFEDWSNLMYYVGENRCEMPPEDEGDPIGELPTIPLDFGDAPDPLYPTLLNNDGARHMMAPDLFLGMTRDDESNGQPNVGGTGDDANGATNDEDGVTFPAFLKIGQTSVVSIVASKSGFLDAWIDFNNDGDWADAGEQIASKLAVSTGSNQLNVTVPANAQVSAATFARFRLSSVGGLAPTGLALDGEVEDYAIAIQLPAPPKMESVVINDNFVQRSQVTSVTVHFDSLLILPANAQDAFDLKKTIGGATVTLAATVSGTSKTSVTLTFVGGAVDGISLADGRYILTALQSKISNAGGALDGDGNGSGGDDYVLNSSGSTGVFRLFGDSDGNGSVSAADFASFRSFFGLGSSIFDFNGDQLTNASDFAQFRSRFGIAI